MALQFIIIQADELIAVDNCAISPLSLTGLAANIGQISYQKDGGKLQYNDRPPTPVEFTDPAPYQPYLNTWITAAAALIPPLQLAQAHQVKSDLVDSIFHHKRRLPFSSGGWSWDANDDSVANLNVVLGSTSVDSTSGLVTQINTKIVNQNNVSASLVNGHLNQIILGAQATGTTYYLVTTTSDPYTGGGFQTMAQVTATGGGISYAGNINCQPLNAATLQSIPASTVSTALEGIAARYNTLNSNRLTKRIAINNLTTIPNVVAYDATTGWSF